MIGLLQLRTLRSGIRLNSTHSDYGRHSRYYRAQLSRKYHHIYSNSQLQLANSRHRRAVVVVSSYLAGHNHAAFGIPLYNYYGIREFRINQQLYENPSSKVEVTVQTMKNKQKEKVEEIIKEAASGSSAISGTSTNTEVAVESQPKQLVVKKSWKTKIWDEVLHYYHGFRLLFIDINVCRKLLMRVLNGKTLTRRENKLLVRTTSDVFRLIPFSVFIIVPFMEFLLPVFIKFFPGMLPSTFQTAKEREDKLKQSLQVKLEMAKFLQKTLDEMAVQHKEHKSEEAKLFAEFFEKIKNPNEYVSSDDIIKYAKRFSDEITLDSLSRVQLAALCRLLELNTMGTTNFLRFQLRVKLRSLAADDRVIAREGVNALDLCELQQACKARGMRAYGLTDERLRYQLQEWIDLSLNERVPPTLLLLSRAMLISDDKTTSHKLKETIRVLPDSVAAQTKAAIGEREGKIDNKTKIEIIKEEERRIKEEREEEREEAIAISEAKTQEEPPVLDPVETCSVDPFRQTIAPYKTKELTTEAGDTMSSKDAALLSDALKSLSSDSKKLMVEKEAIKDLKEEMQDYKEDVEELREVRSVVQEPVHESRAAKLLFKKVNKMIGALDKVLADLEKQQKKIKGEHIDQKPESPEVIAAKQKEEELVRIDDLVDTIKKLKQTSDASRHKSIEAVLDKLDTDKDGVITVNEVFKVVEAISRDNVHLNEHQVEELLTLLDKEQLIEAEEKIEKAIAKSIKEAKRIEEDKKKEEAVAMEKAAEAVRAADKAASEAAAIDVLKDTAPVLKDKATDLSVGEEKLNIKTETKSQETEHLLEAAEKQEEKLIPKSDISAAMPPPPAPKKIQANSKDKRI